MLLRKNNWAEVEVALVVANKAAVAKFAPDVEPF
jgi:hypothetical protein